MKWLLLFLPFLGGIAGGAQAPINSELGKRVGLLEAAFVSFSVGAVVLGLLAMGVGRGELARVAGVPRWMLLGGLLGGTFVTAIIYTVPRLGAATTIFAAIAGQMFFTLAADHFGFFGLERIPFRAERAAALVLMLAGVLLVFRSR